MKVSINLSQDKTRRHKAGLRGSVAVLCGMGWDGTEQNRTRGHDRPVRGREGGRAGQGRVGQRGVGGTGQGIAGQGMTGRAAECNAGQGKAGQCSVVQGRAGQGKTRQGMTLGYWLCWINYLYTFLAFSQQI